MADDDMWSESTYKTLLVVQGGLPLIVTLMSAGLLDCGQSEFNLTVDDTPHDLNS